MRSWLTFYKDGKEVGKGRWDGRSNEKTAPEIVNWDYRNMDFDEAVCETEGGKRLVVKKNDCRRSTMPSEKERDEKLGELHRKIINCSSLTFYKDPAARNRSDCLIDIARSLYYQAVTASKYYEQYGLQSSFATFLKESNDHIDLAVILRSETKPKT